MLADAKAFLLYYGRTSLWNAQDLFDAALRRRTPPRHDSLIGLAEDADEFGRELVGQLIDPGGLQPDHRVLDVGSGVGRIARPLIDVIGERGSYEGFDIGKSGIRWCKRNIMSDHPNFRFEWASIYNKMYNRRGRSAASDYRFPYEDGEFDFAFATSVFTHMLPDDTRNYLRETGRVLKPGGRLFYTFFLTETRDGKIDRPDIGFPAVLGECRVLDATVPEKRVAYEEEWVRARFSECGLEIEDPISYGEWPANRENTLSYQDVVIATKS